MALGLGARKKAYEITLLGLGFRFIWLGPWVPRGKLDPLGPGHGPTKKLLMGALLRRPKCAGGRRSPSPTRFLREEEGDPPLLLPTAFL